MNLKETPFLGIDTLEPSIQMEQKADGIIYLSSKERLEPVVPNITNRLKYWAVKTPDKVFLGQRDAAGKWRKLSYSDAWLKVQAIGQYLLQTNASIERPIVILSGNSIEHGLLALAALHVGIPYSPVNSAYATLSSDFEKLKHCIDLLTPGLIFVDRFGPYEKAINAVAQNIPVLTVSETVEGNAIFDEVVNTTLTNKVEEANQGITADTIAKILFTSGSTGFPKGVINTHGNITSNWQQITQIFPLMKNGGLRLIDWLPWHHTFGGNHNFGLTLFNGGSLFIDGGNPTPKGIKTTVKNLKDIAPTVFFNVPKGYEELLPYLKADKELCQFFFNELKMFFYAGASLPQLIWDELEQLSFDTIGKRLLIATGYGMTESSPSTLFNTELGSTAGRLGVPVPGLEVKLVPDGDKIEVRFKGSNITRGYWRNESATVNAFDEEGFYRTGDALKLIDHADPNKGLVFDGRILEDFKLDTGTWVSVGALRPKFIAAGEGIIQDVVITGHDRAYVGAIVIPELNYCREFTGLPDSTPIREVISHPKITTALQTVLNELGAQSTGSSNCIRRAVFADFDLSIELGEITDKGSVNQRAVLKHRAALVEQLYQKELSEIVLHY